MQVVPKFASFNGIAVEILRTGHFPHSVIIKEIVSGLQYEVELAQLTF